MNKFVPTATTELSTLSLLKVAYNTKIKKNSPSR